MKKKMKKDEFLRIAGEAAKEELKSYDENTKGWLMLLLVDYTARLWERMKKE